MALSELRRLSAGRLPRIAILAMVLIPTLYAGMYLYANHDPYGGLSRVPAALVVDDTGADVDGDHLDAGRQVADQLLESDDFAWSEVDADQAAEGVRDGTYDFALTIPADFSTALTSSARLEPERARLQLTTNDANSYLSTTIADTVVQRVRDAVASQVSEEAAERFLLSLAQIRSDLLDASDGAGQLRNGAASAVEGADQLVTGTTQLSAGATDLADGLAELSGGVDELANGLDTLQTQTAGLPSDTATLAEGARQVADANDQIAEIGDTAAGVVDTLADSYAEGRTDLVAQLQASGLNADEQAAILAIYDGLGEPVESVTTRVDETSTALDDLASGADQVAAGNEALAAATPALVAGISSAVAGADQLNTGAQSASDGADDLSSGASELASGASELDTGLVQLSDGINQLATGLDDGVEQIPLLSDDERRSIAQTLGNPLDIGNESDAEAASYGAGLAPFFLALAAWIGGYVLFLLVRPLSSRALAANQASLRVALGGWLAPAVLGVAQMLIALTVVALAVGIDLGDMVRTGAFMALVSVTFIAIVHMLNAWLGAAGQFLGLVLMVLQLVTAGGTFPWQTLPEALHPAHHLLPMTYAVDGLRQLMYGGETALALHAVLVLLAWLAAAIGLSALAARRQRVWSVSRVRPELTL